MRLTVLICLYLTFLEASVGSLIYPERTLIQMLLGQGRMVTVDELITAGEAIGQPRPDGAISSDLGTPRFVQRKLMIDAEVAGETPTEQAVSLKKVKRKLATKKPVKRLVNSRASGRPKVDQPRSYGEDFVHTDGNTSGELRGDRNGEQQQLRRLTSAAFRRSRPRARRSLSEEEMERPYPGAALMDVLRFWICLPKPPLASSNVVEASTSIDAFR
uniref:Uncharacterized protein n=1 Tax=Anopheles culicifacies TaxID=139723 RepID=A0A182LZE3_9DIPT